MQFPSVTEFRFAKIPTIEFGSGTFERLPLLIGHFGSRVLLITGSRSYKASPQWERLLSTLSNQSIQYFHHTNTGEPSPDFVDETVALFRNEKINVVVSWGGGSVVDAGKAVSAMLPQAGSVLDYLEGVGTGAAHDGRKIPFIAVPTTAGTGSEATKNAVLSRVGPEGFKKSIRHDNFVPDIALVDPQLAVTCPDSVTAACGLDAFTQLLEAYASTEASPLTDALAWSGLEKAADSLIPVSITDPDNIDLRADMAYASLMSGITLANAGLGVVHGLASPIGGYFPIPHGVVCGTLVGAASQATIDKLARENGEAHPALAKYARVGFLLAGKANGDVKTGCRLLIDTLDEWLEILQIPRLSGFGITENDFDKIIDGTGNKNNPIALETDEIRAVLQRRL